MTDRFSEQGKARYVARHQHWRTVCNSLVMCFFAVVAVQTVLEQVQAATRPRLGAGRAAARGRAGLESQARR